MQRGRSGNNNEGSKINVEPTGKGGIGEL
jgi:hypothetical protein